MQCKPSRGPQEARIWTKSLSRRGKRVWRCLINYDLLSAKSVTLNCRAFEGQSSGTWGHGKTSSLIRHPFAFNSRTSRQAAVSIQSQNPQRLTTAISPVQRKSTTISASFVQRSFLFSTIQIILFHSYPLKRSCLVISLSKENILYLSSAFWRSGCVAVRNCHFNLIPMHLSFRWRCLHMLIMHSYNSYK